MTPQYIHQSVMLTQMLNRLGKRSPLFLSKLYDKELQVINFTGSAYYCVVHVLLCIIITYRIERNLCNSLTSVII